MALRLQYSAARSHIEISAFIVQRGQLIQELKDLSRVALPFAAIMTTIEGGVAGYGYLLERLLQNGVGIWVSGLNLISRCWSL